jgi:hypothetical protein
MLQRRILPVSRFARQVLPQQSRIVKAAGRRFQSTEAPIATPVPKPPRRNGWRRLFRYTWRATYLSAIGGIGFFAYRMPCCWIMADFLRSLSFSSSAFNAAAARCTEEDVGYSRQWMGKHESSQVVEHRGISCHCGVAKELLPLHSYRQFSDGADLLALLPSTTTGLVESRSIMQPIRHILRYKKAAVQFFEADCTSIDPVNKTLTITGISLDRVG